MVENLVLSFRNLFYTVLTDDTLKISGAKLKYFGFTSKGIEQTHFLKIQKASQRDWVCSLPLLDLGLTKHFL